MGLPTVHRDYSLSAPSARVFSASVSRSNQSESDAAWARQFDDDLSRLEQKLRGWLRDRSSLEGASEGEPPSRLVIERALEIVNEQREWAMDGVPRPALRRLSLRGMALESDGEITFEFDSPPYSLTTRVECDGTVERLTFKDRKLLHRARVR